MKRTIFEFFEGVDYLAEKLLMDLQDERNAIVRQYKRHEIRSKDAIRLLRENEKKMTEAKRQYAKAKKNR